MAIGFADETGIQYPQNNARFGSLFPHLKRQINSELGSQKFFGFYVIEGNSSLTDMQKSKAEDFKAPLLASKEANSNLIKINNSITLYKYLINNDLYNY